MVNNIEVEDNKNTEVKNHQKTFQSQKTSNSKKKIGSLNFFTFGARLVFIKMR